MSVKLALAKVLYWWMGLFEDPVHLFIRLGVKSSDHILEIGCAIGFHTSALAQIASNGKVLAVDTWNEGVAYVSRRLEHKRNVQVICMAAELLELPLSSLDKIVCFDTFHEVSNHERALEKWAAFLRKEGTFCYRDPVISAQEIERLSKGKLCRTGDIERAHIFLRQ